MKKFIRNLLIGEKHIPALGEYKYAMLRGQYALILITASLFYICLDAYNDMQPFMPYYIANIFIGAAIMYLNRRGFYNAATFILLVTINTVVFLFAEADIPSGGVFFFFIASSLTGLVMIGYYNAAVGFLFALLPIVLGYAAYLLDLGILPHPSTDPDLIKINFIANFTIGILVSILCVHFLMNRNKEAERFLLQSEQHLKKTSDDLRRSEERFELALKGTRAGIYEWNIISNQVYVSDYWKLLLGYAPEEIEKVTAETFLSMVHPDDLARTSASVNNSVQEKKPYQNEVRLRIKSGDYHWFLDSGIIKSDNRGMPELAVGSIIDIQERKAAEEKIWLQNELLAKANKELDHFVYSVSHDLRAPLSSILGLTNIYALTEDKKEREAIIKMISDRVHILDNFIREVLDYSRNSRVDIKFHKFSLTGITEEVLEGLRHMQGIDQIEIKMRIDPGMKVITDADRLKVMIRNLLTNAINYRDQNKNSYINIDASESKGQWSFSVTDNGIGIKPEHQEKIFDMFYKANDSGQGTGLGLYIVQETLQRLRGNIDVQSVYGEGSSFTVTMPNIED